MSLINKVQTMPDVHSCNMCNYKIQLYSIVSIRVRLQFVSKHKANRMTHVNSCSIIVRV